MKSFSDLKKTRELATEKVIRDKYYREEIYNEGEWVLTESGNVGRIVRRGPNYVICVTAEESTFRTWIKDIKEVFEIGTDAYREYVMSLTPGQAVKKPSGSKPVSQIIPPDPKKDKMDKHESLVDQVAGLLDDMDEAKKKGLDGKACWKGYKLAGTKKKGGKTVDNCVKAGVELEGEVIDEKKYAKAKEPGKAAKKSAFVKKHDCATHAEHSEWGKGVCMKEMHTLDEEGNVSHYDIMFEHGLEQNVPVATLNILRTEAHEHAINWDKNQEVLDEKKKKLDPVGKEDGDVDNDGDKDASDSYLMNRRRAVARAMGKKTKKEEVELEEKKGLYANIHAKRKRGESPAKPGDKDYPAKDAFKKAAKTAKEGLSFSDWRTEINEKKS